MALIKKPAVTQFQALTRDPPRQKEPPPSLPKFVRKYNRAEKCTLILRFLKEEGVVPYFATAAERAGVHRDTARRWLTEGLHEPDPITPGYLEMNEFMLEVKRIQAEWVAKAVKDLAQGDETSTERKDKAKHLMWLLLTLDGETFDPPKKVANVLKDAKLPGEEPPPAKEALPEEVAAAAAALTKAN